MNIYVQSLFLADRVYNLFLNAIKQDLQAMKIDDISAPQALIIYNIRKERLSVSEIVARKYYLGSNVSYSLRKMVESGYIVQEASQTDQRVQYVSLTEKGLALYDTLEKTFQNHLKVHEQQDIHNLKQSLKNIENNLILQEAKTFE